MATRIFSKIFVAIIFGASLNLFFESCNTVCRIDCHKVFCKNLSKKYGIILNDSEKLSMDEIYEAEMIYFQSMPSDRTVDEYKKYYRQYCKKTINGNTIIFINYFLFNSSRMNDLDLLSEPYIVLTEPYAPIINDLCFINLTEKRVCDIPEHNLMVLYFFKPVEKQQITDK